MSRRIGVGLLAVVLLGAALTLGCSRSGPTQPPASTVSNRGDAVWGARGVVVYRIPNDPQRLLVRFSSIIVDDPVTGERSFITVDEAEKLTMPSDQVVRWSSTWRTIPAQSFTGTAPNLSDFPEPSGRHAERFDGHGEDPPPVLPPSGCGCSCSGTVTWGCLKCCYR